MGRARQPFHPVLVAERGARFESALGTRRGSALRAAADHDWRAVLAQQRAEQTGDPTLLARALAGDLAEGFRHTAASTLQQLGVASAKARHIVLYSGKTLHLLATPLAEQRLHPSALCGRRLLSEKVDRARRGDWTESPRERWGPVTDLKRCTRCAKLAGSIPEAAERAPLSPFFPEDQSSFEDALAGICQALAERALAGAWPAAKLAENADAAYIELLMETAVALAVANPTRSRRAAFPDHPDAYQLRERLGYPGELDELLTDIDFAALFAPMAPAHRRDGRNTMITTWQQHRANWEEQLTSAAAQRSAGRRLELAAAALGAARENLTAAQAEFEFAQAAAPPKSSVTVS